MTYRIIQSDSFKSEFARYASLKARMADVLFELMDQPITNNNQGNIKKLAGFETLYRYRIGDFRLIYAVHDQEFVQLLMIGSRADIYERLMYDPQAPDPLRTQLVEATLLPQSAAAQRQRRTQYWENFVHEQLEQENVAQRGRPLAQSITLELLQALPNIPSHHHQVLMACRTEDDLLDAESVPEDVRLMLVERLGTISLLELGQQPLKVISRPNDLAEYAEGRLSDFLLLLDETQQQMIDWALKGPTLVKGGPGSGKSTVAMYRLREVMQRAHTEGRPLKVLFTTYTNALVNVTQQLLDRLLEGFNGTWEVSTVDKLAAKYARQGGLANRERAGQSEWQTAMEQELSNPSIPADIKALYAKLGSIFFQEEFEQVIEGRGITEPKAYLDADRTGRRVALRHIVRAQLFAFYQRVKGRMRSLTWGDVRTVALRHLQQHGGDYDYVVVDEAQDLTPQAIQMCLALAKSPTGVYLTADLSQSIYNRGFPLSRIPEMVEATRRTRILRRNYRSTVEIVRAAAQILSESAGDEETLSQACTRNGPKPTLIHLPHDDVAAVAREIQSNIRRHLRTLKMPLGSVAVLCRSSHQCESITDALKALGISVEKVNSSQLKLDSPSVKVITLHSAKGLEFPIVFIPFADVGSIPRYDDLSEDTEAQKEVEERERRLFFVGLTRAMRRLVVMTSGDQHLSPFLADTTELAWNVEYAG